MERFRQEHHFRVAQDQAMGDKWKTNAELETDEIIFEAAYQKALATETDQIQEEASVSVYGNDAVQADLRRVKERKQTFASKEDPRFERGYKQSRIMEAFLTEQIDLNQWFGEGVTTQQTSEFDDVFRGVDMVIKFPGDVSPILVDVTSGTTEILEKKLARLVETEWKWNLGDLRYDQSPDGEPKGPLTNAPRVVLVLKPDYIATVARLWVQGKQRALAEHPIRALLLHEVLIQLEGQMKLAEQLDQPEAHDVLAKSCAYFAALIEKEKLEVPKNSVTGKGLDPQYLRLKRTFNRLFGFSEQQGEKKTRGENAPLGFDASFQSLTTDELAKALMGDHTNENLIIKEMKQRRNSAQIELGLRSRSGDAEAREALRAFDHFRSRQKWIQPSEKEIPTNTESESKNLAA